LLRNGRHLVSRGIQHAMHMGSKFWIAKTLYRKMCDFADRSFPYETGGILVGYVADNCDVVVKAIIGPGPNARHRRYRFKPDAEYQQTQLEAHHSRTNGEETYLGDWHTHPRGTPSLSYIDKRTLARIASSPPSGTVTPVMSILGGYKRAWLVGAVRFRGATRGILFRRYDLEVLSALVYD